MGRKLIAAVLFVAVLLTTLPFTASALKYETNATGAVLYEPVTGRVLCDKNKDQKLPMASTTKIMTALLAIECADEHGGLNAQFTVGDEVRVEGTSMGLKEGDTVTLWALVCGMLMESGNDGANAVAIRIAGSKEEFAKLMNARAAEIGMTNSHFVTPSGLDDEAHYSTAYDMALLGAAALKNEKFREVCSSKKQTVSYGAPPYSRTLYGHNRMLSSYEGAIGIKTGFTDSAKRCLVSAAERNGILLIAVTLNCGDDWNVHSEMLDYGFSALSLQAVPLTQGDYTLPVGGGAQKYVVARVYGDLALPLAAGERERLSVEIHLPRFLIGKVEEGQVVGYAKVLLDGKIIKEYEIKTVTGVALSEERPNLWQRLLRLFS